MPACSYVEENCLAAMPAAKGQQVHIIGESKGTNNMYASAKCE